MDNLVFTIYEIKFQKATRPENAFLNPKLNPQAQHKEPLHSAVSRLFEDFINSKDQPTPKITVWFRLLKCAHTWNPIFTAQYGCQN